VFEPRKIYPTGASETEREAFADGLRRVARQYGIGRMYPHVLGGERIMALDAALYSTNDPNDITVLAYFPWHNMSKDAEQERINALLGKVSLAQKRWARVPAEKRIRLVRTIGQLMSDQMWFFLALMAREGGKRPFPNGVGEFIEVIDFCNNAALLAEQMYTEASPIAPDFMCDFNGWVWEPKGVIVDIEPFNFAQAIPMDKIAMALATGNAIVMKASGHTPLQAYAMYEVIQSAFDACGLENNGVVNFLSGHGADMARFLLENENVNGYTFTGSYDAYWSIQRDIMSKPRPHGGKMQEIAAETSGCNAMIIAASADIDAAVIAARDSLINNNGQTCSHLGHLIVDEKVRREFVSKFHDALDEVRYGDVKNLENQCGALISADAVKRCHASIQNLMNEGLVTPYWSKSIKARGAFDFEPRILTANKQAYTNDDLLRKVRSTEIFGMCVTMWFTDTREEAKRIFETCTFGLTGGIFTRDVDYALEFALHYKGAAQKYVNTRITGATVGMAFGGSALSGSSGDGVGASTKQALQKYVSHVNVAVKRPGGLDHLHSKMWDATFGSQMTIAPEFE
jgi:acyl-CoA reductase-like NAD-dependent aldehyde dehydrogenase